MAPRTLAIAALAAIIATGAAHAQSGWNSYPIGNQQYYNGTGQNSGWNGSSYNIGDHTYSHFQGPNGQTRNCSSYSIGDHVYTNCN